MSSDSPAAHGAALTSLAAPADVQSPDAATRLRDRARAGFRALQRDRARALDLSVYALTLASVGACLGVGVVPVVGVVLVVTGPGVMSIALLRAPRPR